MRFILTENRFPSSPLFFHLFWEATPYCCRGTLRGNDHQSRRYLAVGAGWFARTRYSLFLSFIKTVAMLLILQIDVFRYFVRGKRKRTFNQLTHLTSLGKPWEFSNELRSMQLEQRNFHLADIPTRWSRWFWSLVKARRAPPLSLKWGEKHSRKPQESLRRLTRKML